MEGTEKTHTTQRKWLIPVLAVVIVICISVVVCMAFFVSYQQSAYQQKLGQIQTSLDSIQEENSNLTAMLGTYVDDNARLQSQLERATAEADTGNTDSADTVEEDNTSLISDLREYEDARNGMSFRFPAVYEITDLGSGTMALNDRIIWRKSNTSLLEARGDGPVIEDTRELELPAGTAIRISGYLGAVGGNVPQTFVAIELPTPDGQYLVFTQYELPISENSGSDQNLERPMQPIPSNKVEELVAIVETVQFEE